MNINGRIKVFRDEHNGRNGTWYSYRGYIGNKLDDGTWDNDPYEISLAKEAKGAVIENGSFIEVTDGFLSCRSYTDKGGEKQIVSQMVVQAFTTVDAPRGYTALTEDVPF